MQTQQTFDRRQELLATLLHHRQPLLTSDLQQRFGVCRSAFYRDINYLRDEKSYPIVTGRNSERQGTVWIDRNQGLPRNPFSSPLTLRTLRGIRVMALLAGDLGQQLFAPYASDIDQAILQLDRDCQDQQWRFKATQPQSRPAPATVVQDVADAVLRRRRLQFTYRSFHSGTERVRTVHPQMVEAYKGTQLYLLAVEVDDEDNTLKTFAMDRMDKVSVMDSPAKDLTPDEINLHTSTAYGAFHGVPDDWACIRFSGNGARYARERNWHQAQRWQDCDNGSLILKLPYASPEELVRDVLAFGGDAEILDPPELRTRAKAMIASALDHYR